MVSGPSEASPGVLNSWKEIAAYLDRDVRTVMRWEQARGLPVHRLPGGPKSAVYAVKSELEAWRQGVKAAVVELQNEPRPLKDRFSAAWNARSAVVLLACVLLAAASVVVIRAFVRGVGSKPLPSLSRVTYDHAAVWPTISADGKLVAYASDREGKFDIYIQQMGGHQPIRVTRNDADNWRPALSPDGSHIVFRSDRDGGGLYIVEALGGTERRIADRGDFPAYSPEGSTIAYLVRDAFTGWSKMFLIPADGGSPRRFQPDFDVPGTAMLFTFPMWSPDGKYIAFEGVRRGDGGTRALWVAPAAGGTAARLETVPPNARGTFRVWFAWAGRYLYYAEGTSVQGTPLLRVPIASNPWRVAGKPERLTSSPTVCAGARVAGDGQVVLMIANPLTDIWSMPLQTEGRGAGDQLRKAISGADNKLAMSVAADGSRLAYAGVFDLGRFEIQLIDLRTQNRAAVPLSGDLANPLVRLRADGDLLSYRDLAGGRVASYVVPAANPVQNEPFCEGCSVMGFFSNSADLLVARGSRLVRQNIASGFRNTLIESPAADPVLSPDDRWLAFVGPKSNGTIALFAAAVREGEGEVSPEEWKEVAEDRNFIGSPQWSRDGKMLYYISNRDSFSCVWAQAFDTVQKRFGKPVPVYHGHWYPSLKVSPARSIAVTSDRIYLLMTSTSSNIWRMKVE
jgi:Tol biopolymer transport system component